MSGPKNREELISLFSSISTQFEEVSREVNSRERSMLQAFDKVASAASADPLAGSELAADHPLRKFVADNHAVIQGQIKGWLEDAKNYERNTDFRSRHGDSLLIYVYGKVKAGKSSLGNFLAYGQDDPGEDAVKNATPSPRFFMETATGKCEGITEERMASQQHFKVGITECTDGIQGFCLPGLTWVDSPGIHAMTQENGQLAKDYAASADLVVFAMNSSNPGRRTDLEEVAGLLKKKKPLIVLLTASDTVEEDEDSNGNLISTLVMKSEQDRADQVAYVENELAVLTPELKKLLLGTGVIPISVRYAATKGSGEGGWEASGMAEFSSRLAAISTSQGMELKQRAPLNNLLAFCGQLEQSRDALTCILNDLRLEIDKSRADIRSGSDRALSAVKRELTLAVDRLAEEFALNDAAYCEACAEEADEILRRHVEAFLSDAMKQLETALDASLRQAGEIRDIPGFSKRQKTVTIHQRTGKATGKGAGQVVGTIIGTYFGGPAGAVVGGILGDIIGGQIGKMTDGETECSVDLGDNRLEVAQGTREMLARHAEDVLESLSQQLDKNCFFALESWLACQQEALGHLGCVLKDQQSSLKEESAHAAA